MKTNYISLLTLSLFVSHAPLASATLIVYESFTGYNSGTLIGQASQATGGTGSWEKRFTSQPQDYTVNATSLSYGTLATSGGSLTFGNSATTSSGAAFLPLSASAIAAANPAANSTTTLWLSFLWQTPGALGGTATVGFARDNASLLWGTGVVARDPSGYGNRIDTNQVVGGSVSTSTTYFYLSKITLENTDGDPQWETGTMQTWQYSGGTLPTVAPTLGGVTSTFSLTIDRRLQGIVIQPGSISGSYSLDELRLATTFADAIPEPNSLALLGLGALAITIATRKRRKGINVA